jgi:hypothetical protein
MAKKSQPVQTAPASNGTYLVPVTISGVARVMASCHGAAVSKVEAIFYRGFRHRKTLMLPLTEHVTLDATKFSLVSADTENVEKELG